MPRSVSRTDFAVASVASLIAASIAGFVTMFFMLSFAFAVSSAFFLSASAFIFFAFSSGASSASIASGSISSVAGFGNIPATSLMSSSDIPLPRIHSLIGSASHALSLSASASSSCFASLTTVFGMSRLDLPCEADSIASSCSLVTSSSLPEPEDSSSAVKSLERPPSSNVMPLRTLPSSACFTPASSAGDFALKFLVVISLNSDFGSSIFLSIAMSGDTCAATKLRVRAARRVGFFISSSVESPTMTSGPALPSLTRET